MDPYAELGLPRDADEATVKRAYRARAMKAHPDKGGTSEGFHAIQTAYEILTDPKRRDRFDRTGDTAPAQDPQAVAMMAVAKMVLEVVGQVPDIEHTDLMAVMRSHANEQLARVRRVKADTERSIEKHERAAARFKKAGTGVNAIAQIIEAQVARSRASLAGCDDTLAAIDQIIAVLAEYSYQVDEVSWPGGMHVNQSALASMFQGGQQR